MAPQFRRQFVIAATLGLLIITGIGSLQACRISDSARPALGAVFPVDECPTDHERADVRVTQQLSPSSSLQAGNSFVTAIVIRNVGRCPADNAVVTLPFDPATTLLIDAQTGRPQTWVSSVTPDALLLESGPLGAGQIVTATVRLRAVAGLPVGTLLQQRLTFTADHNIAGPSGSSNLAILQIGPADHSALLALGVIPQQAPAGTVFEFGSSAFAPAEPVSAWINDALDQDRPLTTTLSRADGSITLAVPSSDLSPATYRLIAFGHYSGLTAEATFQVLPPLTPSVDNAAAETPPAVTVTSSSTPTIATASPTSEIASPTLTATMFFTFTVDTASPTLTSTSTMTPTATLTSTPTATATVVP